MKIFKFRKNDSVPGEDAHISDTGEPADRGIPMEVFQGYVPAGFHVTVPGASSYQGDPSPVTFARYNMSRGMHDVQLSNGWQFTNYGKRTVYASSGYLNVVQPQIPGQSRLYGQNGPPQPFVPRGGAPSLWQQQVDRAQSMPKTPGGPGQILGALTYMGQSGG